VIAVVLLGGWELLRRKTIAPVPADRAIAVLPFTVPGGNSTEYIADGITESLINALAEEPHIRVLARSTVFRFKGSKLTPQEVGRTLGVDAVFVAGMQQEGDMANVSAELVSARDGAHLWGDRYTRKATDLIVIQDDLARGLAQALQLDHMPRELSAVGELRERAHALYLRGEHELNARNLRAASDYFHRASVADPSYALPYAGTADALTLSARYAAAPVAEFAPAARQAARKALALDPSSPEAHVSLASVYDTCDWHFAAAEQEYRKAIALRPGDVLAHQWHALLLARLGRIADAVAERQRALALDPYSPVLHLFAANIDYYAGRYDSAAAFCAEAIALEPRLPFAHVQMALIRLQQHRYADAQNELGLDAGRPSAPSIATRAVLDALEGDPAAAAKSLDALPAGEADYARAVVNATVGRIDDALDSLQRAFAERSVYASYAAVEPLLEPLHAHPRFAALVRDAGLRRR
jgi:TolB-like protein/Tfp pilus assembly protein PilF